MTKPSCTIEGCARLSYRRGLCRGHAHRLKKYGDPFSGHTARGAPMEFLLSALSADHQECVIWPFSAVTHPETGITYGQVWHEGRLHVASRLVCEKAYGPAPTDRHQAAHRCGHSLCINRSHVRWATPEENYEDKVDHDRLNRGERCGTSVLTEVQVLEIKALVGTMRQKDIADRFGVPRTTISSIVTGKSWAWLCDGAQS